MNNIKQQSQKFRHSTLITDMRPANMPTSHTVRTRKMSPRKKKLLITILIIVIAMLGIGFKLNHSRSVGSTEQSRVKSEVGKLMVLPVDEEPTLAIVDDTSKLTDPFLKSKAQNGDQILLYTKNKEAIIYRPSIHKIVAVAPLAVDLALREAQGASITLLNGTTDPRVTDKVEAEIKKAYPDVTISTRTANRRDFTQTVVIDNTDKKDNLVESLAGITKGKRGVVPLGEDEGDTDLVILIGEDQL